MLKRIICIVTALIIISSLSACMPKPKDPEVLGAEMERQIKQTYYDEYIKTSIDIVDVTVDDIYIGKYYGTYNYCVAIMVFYKNQPINDACAEIIVAGIKFQYSDGSRIVVWKENKFYDLKTAYTEGLLKRKDIKGIAYYHKEK